MAPPKHCAKFSKEVLDALPPWMVIPGVEEPTILDPYGGVGLITGLRDRGVKGTFWVQDLEPEWALQTVGADRIIVGNSLFLTWLEDRGVDIVGTSIVYPNRLTDAFQPSPKNKWKYHNYQAYLGRILTPGSSANMGWGPEWREFHEVAFAEIARVVRRRFALNISDHWEGGDDGDWQHVDEWCHQTICQQGNFKHIGTTDVPTKRLKHGSNRKRAEFEKIFVYERT